MKSFLRIAMGLVWLLVTSFCLADEPVKIKFLSPLKPNQLGPMHVFTDGLWVVEYVNDSNRMYELSYFDGEKWHASWNFQSTIGALVPGKGNSVWISAFHLPENKSFLAQFSLGAGGIVENKRIRLTTNKSDSALDHSVRTIDGLAVLPEGNGIVVSSSRDKFVHSIDEAQAEATTEIELPAYNSFARKQAPLILLAADRQLVTVEKNILQENAEFPVPIVHRNSHTIALADFEGRFGGYVFPWGFRSELSRPILLSDKHTVVLVEPDQNLIHEIDVQKEIGNVSSTTVAGAKAIVEYLNCLAVLNAQGEVAFYQKGKLADAPLSTWKFADSKFSAYLGAPHSIVADPAHHRIYLFSNYGKKGLNSPGAILLGEASKETAWLLKACVL